MSVPAAQRIVAVSGTLAVGGRCRYMGISWDATADADADVTLYDDIRATAANRLDGIRTITTESGRHWYGSQGILCEAGIFVGTITGALVVTIFYIPQTMLGPGWMVDESGDQRVIHKFVTQDEIDNMINEPRP